ncbi:hypothetical protein LTR78_004807 [Recurvomyces mirabilis]|uniref:Uncharacterized protein n=1 Tax=Recurvomyces mirabilis TaxID=574656 RepID=A0AAE0WP40_9PEZI|nr:hypothetical protein LTR78_004807 [Recurvomyces mirabilis]
MDLKGSFEGTQDPKVQRSAEAYVKATNGYYQNTFFTSTGKGGIIFATQNNGPHHEVQEAEKSGASWKDAQGRRLPNVPLEKWSDVVGLTWLELTKNKFEQRKGLRWIHRGVITNAGKKGDLRNDRSQKRSQEALCQEASKSQRVRVAGTRVVRTRAKTWSRGFPRGIGSA